MTTAKKRMPPLTMDEVLLLVDTYYCLQDIESKEAKEEIIADLSNAMRSLPFFQRIKDNPSFRSIDGMKMCLANVAWADPNTNCKFGHGSLAQRKVLEYYIDKKAELHETALAIRKLAKVDFPIKEKFHSFIGGAMIPSFHCYLEMTNKTISAISKEAIAQHQTRCRICGCDLSAIYGSRASELIELHINLPMPQNIPSVQLAPSDLILICPTCHKLVHSDPRYYEIDRLQTTIKAGC